MLRFVLLGSAQWSGIGNISDAQRANIIRFVHDAQSRGIASRFWDTPGWPIFARLMSTQYVPNDVVLIWHMTELLSGRNY